MVFAFSALALGTLCFFMFSCIVNSAWASSKDEAPKG